MPSQLIARRVLLGAGRRNHGKLSEALPNVALVVNEVTGNSSVTSHLSSRSPRWSWCELRTLVAAQAPWLSAPQPGRPGLCAVCRGPSGRRARCFQCELHDQCARGALADVVLPVAYSPKESPHARHLLQYKVAGYDRHSDPPVAALLLLALLLVFLHDHASCAWRAAGAGADEATHVAVVPTTRSRPGEHPLRALIAPYLTWPWANLSARPDQRQRDLDPNRFSAEPVPGARVLLVDDTWATGARAQSAAMALRRAGARSVATIVIGRHLSPAQAPIAEFTPAKMPFAMDTCAVHPG